MWKVDIYLENAGKSVKRKKAGMDTSWPIRDSGSTHWKSSGKRKIPRMNAMFDSGWLQREIQHKEENKDV